MSKRNPIHHSFQSGEISPRLWRRDDLGQHRTGMSLCENFIPVPHGGLFYRLGLNYERQAINNSRSRLRSFRDGDVDVLVEISEGQIRVDGLLFAAPYIEADLPEIQFAQDNRRRMFMFHGNHPVQLLERTQTGWEYAPAQFFGLPVYSYNDDLSPLDATLGGVRTMDFSALVAGDVFVFNVNGTDSNPVTFTTNESQLKFRIEQVISDELREPEIGVTSGVEVSGTLPNLTLNLVNDFAAYDAGQIVPGIGGPVMAGGGIAGTAPGPEPVWSASRGYPRCGAFFGQRLVMGGTESLPNSLWASRVGEPLDLATGPNTSDPLQFEVNSEQPIEIRWIASRNTLAFGTSGGDFILSGQLTSTLDFQIQQQNSKPSALRQPVKIGSSVVYLQEGRQKLRSLSFFEASGTWESVNLSFISEHLLQVPVNDMAWCESPDGFLWLCRDDGLMLSFTYSPTQNIGAWARHKTEGNAFSMACVSTNDGDSLHVQVRRNGRENIEYMPRSTASYTSTEWDGEKIDYIPTRDLDSFLDGSVTVLGSDAVITGLDHLNNQTVSVVVDEALHPDRTVSGGSITLDYTPVSKVVAGQPYLGVGVTLPKRPQAAHHKWGEVHIQLLDSMPPFVDGQREFDRSILDPSNTGVAVYNGHYQVNTNSEDYREGKLVFEQREPFPCHICSYWGNASSVRT